MGDIGIAVVSSISTLFALIATGLLLYDYRITKKLQRLEWGIAMFTYAIGHAMVALMELGTIPKDVLDVWIYINSSGAVTMSLILIGVLPFFFKNKAVVYGIPILFGTTYTVGSVLFGFILEAATPFNIINLSGNYSQLNNMSWYVVALLIPASFVIAFFFFMHYKNAKAMPSLFISIHFLLYALLLFIWPLAEFKFVFYVGRTIATTFLVIGFWMLLQKSRKEI